MVWSIAPPGYVRPPETERASAAEDTGATDNRLMEQVAHKLEEMGLGRGTMEYAVASFRLLANERAKQALGRDEMFFDLDEVKDSHPEHHQHSTS
jgi:hypothetical protein